MILNWAHHRSERLVESPNAVYLTLLAVQSTVRTKVSLSIFDREFFFSFPEISSLNDFNVNKSSKVLPFNVDKNFNLVNEKLSCPPIEATLKIDVDAKAQGSATIGVAISGTILPPKVQDFALISSMLRFSSSLSLYLPLS